MENFRTIHVAVTIYMWWSVKRAKFSQKSDLVSEGDSKVFGIPDANDFLAFYLVGEGDFLLFL